MHKYYLKITKYTESGALTNEAKLISADTEQRLAELEAQYKAMRYVAEDGTVGLKMYKVEVMVTRACPMSDEEWAALKAIHGVV